MGGKVRSSGLFQHNWSEIRYDIPFDSLYSFLRTYYDESNWRMEQKDFSLFRKNLTNHIGVYMKCGVTLHKVIAGFEQGWKAHENFVKRILEEGFDKPCSE